jgi:2-oxoglutarate ferredoxin oxidoreductase subunit beta
MKDHDEVINEVDFVPFYEDISVEIPEGDVQDVKMHDGSTLRIRKLGRDYDPTNKMHALTALHEADQKGEVLTGLLYVDTSKPNFLEMLNMTDDPLGTLPESKTRPPKESLDQIMEELR